MVVRNAWLRGARPQHTVLCCAVLVLVLCCASSSVPGVVTDH